MIFCFSLPERKIDRRFHPIAFEHLENYIDASVDIVGIVRSASEPYQIPVRDGTAERRDVYLCDSELREIRVVTPFFTHFSRTGTEKIEVILERSREGD